ncbi:MAG TPA: ABC transporter substrate-binding protein [Actinomycetota bacterium]|nr:ABC transporter substrate-binding protein [Actinomycetota bacterium]
MLAGALLVALTAACTGGGGGGETEGGADSGGKTTVTFFVAPAETPELDREAQALVDKFEQQNPDINVERETIAAEDQRTVIQTRLRSDNPPDLFGYDTGPGFAGVLAKADLLYDLGPAYKQYGWDIYDWAKQRVTYDGVLSGVPGSVEELGVYYNKDLFDQKGFAEPETLDELKEMADEFKADGLIPFAFGDQEQWPAGHIFSIGVSNMLGPEGLDNILYGNGKWNDPEVVEAIEVMFTDMVEAGYYPEDVNAITYEDSNALFYSGQAPMNITGTWLVSEVRQEVGDRFEVGFFPFPAIDDTGIHPPGGLGGGLFVAKNTDEPEATLKLLDYFLSEPFLQANLELTNTIPALPLETEGLEITPLFQEILNDLSQSSGETAFGYNIDVLTPQGFNDVMFDGFQEVLNGSRTPQEQADALQEAWAKAKAAGEVLEAP